MDLNNKSKEWKWYNFLTRIESGEWNKEIKALASIVGEVFLCIEGHVPNRYSSNREDIYESLVFIWDRLKENFKLRLVSNKDIDESLFRGMEVKKVIHLGIFMIYLLVKNIYGLMSILDFL